MHSSLSKWIAFAGISAAISVSVVPVAGQSRTPNLNAETQARMTTQVVSSPVLIAGGRVVIVRSEANLSASAPVILHFHGAVETLRTALARSEMHATLAIVNFPGLSSAYSQPFETDPELFKTIVQRAVRSDDHPPVPDLKRRLIVSSFSAGYGAVRQIISSDEARDRIDAIVAADSIYASLDPQSPERSVLAAHMRDFKTFARLAAQNQKWLVVSHSAQATPYASTTETTDALLDHLALRRVSDHSISLDEMQQLTSARRGQFAALGFAGDTGPHHLQHLHHIDLLWRLCLPR